MSVVCHKESRACAIMCTCMPKESGLATPPRAIQRGWEKTAPGMACARQTHLQSIRWSLVDLGVVEVDQHKTAGLN
jgi:hypothetical protein